MCLKHVGKKFPAIAERVQEVLANGHMWKQPAATKLLGPLIEQSREVSQEV